MHRPFLVGFAKRKGMEEFKVVPKEEEGRWKKEKKYRFMELVEKALNQIVQPPGDQPGQPSGDDDPPVQVPGDNDQPSLPPGDDDQPVLPPGDPVQGDEWDVDRVIRQSDEPRRRSFESAITDYPRIIEDLQARLSQKDEDYARLIERYENVTAEKEDLKAKILSASEQLAGYVGGFAFV